MRRWLEVGRGFCAAAPGLPPGALATTDQVIPNLYLSGIVDGCSDPDLLERLEIKSVVCCLAYPGGGRAGGKPPNQTRKPTE